MKIKILRSREESKKTKDRLNNRITCPGCGEIKSRFGVETYESYGFLWTKIRTIMNYNCMSCGTVWEVRD